MRDFFKSPLPLIFKSITSWHRGVQKNSAVNIARQRVVIVTIVLFVAFLAVVLRLGDVMLLKQKDRAKHSLNQDFSVHRSDILDRNGEVLATNIVTASAYINAKHVIDIDDAVLKIKKIIQTISTKDLKEKLISGKSFIWLARHITPRMQQEINDLGIPGVYLYKDQTRIYPHEDLCSHIVGFCGLEGEGLSGLEKYFDVELQRDNQPLKISLDIRVQHVLRKELINGVKEFSAKGGNIIAMKVKTGEILGMVSLPDFNPHQLNTAKQDSFFNRNTLGVYEPGSVFKILNVAIALETGRAHLNSVYDTSQPIKIGRFTVTDFRGSGKPLTLQDAFIKSSNIASVKMSQQYGIKTQQDYLKRFGVLDKVGLEISETGSPIIPKKWTEASMMTISYGYGISQTPLQILSVITSLVNNGIKVHPTLLMKDGVQSNESQLISLKTSQSLRHLMRLVVTEGTGRKSEVSGFDVFGKTGTVYQQTKHGYGSAKDRQRTTTFVGGFPYQDPEIMFIVMLDDPKPTKESYGFATAGWNVAKIAKNVIEQVAPLYKNPNYASNVLQLDGENIEDLPKVCSISMKEEENDEFLPY